MPAMPASGLVVGKFGFGGLEGVLDRPAPPSTGSGEHPNRKRSSAKPSQNSQILQWLACHRFGWTFLAAKISRKSPNFCNKFCNRKKP
jgi:hypothetical protein